MNLSLNTLTVHTQNHITIITLNRPDKKNAMNFVMMRELITVAKQLKSHRHIRAVILTGGADFCSGLDLAVFGSPKSMAFACFELIKPSQSLFQKVCLIWQSLPVPVIAVIDGVCLGAGLQLALGADIRISTPAARFAILEAKWGLVADMGLTHTAKDIRTDTLKELAMSARLITADTAQTCQLITHIDSDPLAHATRLASEFSHRSPDAVLAAKRLINGMERTSHLALYQEKLWQIKLILGYNRKIAIKKAKDTSLAFVKRQFK